MPLGRHTFVALAVCAGCQSPDEAPVVPYDLLVTHKGDAAVYRFDGETGAPAGVVVDLDGLPRRAAPMGFEPSDLTVTDDRLWVVNFLDGGVLELDREGGFVSLAYANRHADAQLVSRAEEPAAVRVLDDLVLVLGNDSANVVLLDRDGAFLGELGGPGAEPAMKNAHALAVTPDGRVLVATSRIDAHTGMVQVWDLDSGAFVDAFGHDDVLSDATSLALGPDGRVWVADWVGGGVHAFDLRSGAWEGELGEGRLSHPLSVEPAPSGELLVLDDQGVSRLDPHTGRWLGLQLGVDLDGVAGARNIRVAVR